MIQDVSFLAYAAAYAFGGSLVLTNSNDYHVLLTMQGVTLCTLALILLRRPMKGLATWMTVLLASLVVRLILLGVTRSSETNKAAKMRRWDALVTTVGYAAALGYVMTTVFHTRSVIRYLELTTIGIPVTTATTMALLGSHEYDLDVYATLSSTVYSKYTIRDAATDTRVMIVPRGEVPSSVIIAFAGTDSIENVKTDLRLADTSFPACKQPKTRVHRGFYDAWLAVRDDILENDALTEHNASGDNVPIVCTGHSLGGALATLAGLDIQCTLGVPVSVVTFGSPQVGDELFADAFDAHVTDSIRVITALDPVPRSLSAQFTHVKGVYYVPSVTPNPHDIDGYIKAVQVSPRLRVIMQLVPLVIIAGVTLVIMTTTTKQKARRLLSS